MSKSIQSNETKQNGQNGQNTVDNGKVIEKLNEITNKLSISLNKMVEGLNERFTALEQASLSANLNSTSSTALTYLDESLIDELKQSFNNQTSLLVELKNLTNNNHSSYNKLLGKVENLTTPSITNTSKVEDITKELASLITILNSKIENQSTSISKLEDSFNKEELANVVSLFAEKLNNIEDNQSTDVISILEKLNSTETQLVQSIQVNGKLMEKMGTLENYLITMVKALSVLYQRNDELKTMQAQSISKLDNLTQLLTSVIEAENQAEQPQLKENTGLLTSIKAKMKTMIAPFLRWRTS